MLTRSQFAQKGKDVRILIVSSLERADKIEDFAKHFKRVLVVEDARMFFASNELFGDDVRKLQRSALKQLYANQKVSFVRLRNKTYKEIELLLKQHDLIHIEGGQTYELTSLLAARPRLRELLRSSLMHKGSVGQSAGAIIMGAFNTAGIKGDRGDLPAWIAQKGQEEKPLDVTLGLLKCGVYPHADSHPDNQTNLEKHQLEIGQCIYALGDRGFIEFRGHQSSKPIRMEDAHILR